MQLLKGRKNEKNPSLRTTPTNLTRERAISQGMKTKIPPQAYQFRVTPPELAQRTDVDEAQGEEPRRFRGVGYTGKALRHPYWGVVVFDVAGTRANSPTPILVDHNPAKRAGFATLSFENGQITIDEGTLLDNEHGAAIAAESDQGFPWQMSVYIEPERVEELAAGATTEVNGQAVHGPANIFRGNFIREVSFTPTGVDYETTAEALSAAAAVSTTPQDEEPTMTLEELQEQNAALQASLDAANERASAAEARAQAAEDAVQQVKKDQRMSAVRELFSAIGKDYSDEAAAPYAAMDDAAFAAVSEQMKALAHKAPEELFSAQAESGRNPNAADDEVIDYRAIYASHNGQVS